MIKLLIVDDSALMRRQLSSFFIEEGDFEIHFARNGREAVEENINFQPDVVTLDINMPEMDGFEFLECLADQHYPGKVSLMSGGNNSMLGLASDVALHYGIQLTGFFTKPLAQHSLMRALGAGALA